LDDPRDAEPEVEVKRWLEARGELEGPVCSTHHVVLAVSFSRAMRW
jgi:hypothetical protein